MNLNNSSTAPGATPSEKESEIKTSFKGKIFEIIQKDIAGRSFEIARRSPGVRLLIVNGDKMLITREFRHEHNTYDYRLPGGKVFDTLDEFSQKMQNNEDISVYAQHAANNECKQETGLIPKSLELLTTSKAGSTIEWDLYYFIVREFETNSKGQELEEGEDITTEWKTLDEVKELCLNGSIKEDRSMGILLKYILQNQK